MRRVAKWALISLAGAYLLLLAYLLSIYKLRWAVITDLRIAPVPFQPAVKRAVNYEEDYPEAFRLQVAVLVTSRGHGGLSYVHAFKEMGIPFFVTHDLGTALSHPLVFIYPEVDTDTFTPEEINQLTQYVQRGGAIFAQQVFAKALGSLFGFQAYQRLKSRHWVNFQTVDDPLDKYLDRPEERQIPLAGESVPELFATNGYTPAGSARVLARFEDNSAALLASSVGHGTTYLSGVGYDDVVLRAQCNRHYEAFRHYINAFEPGGDVWLLLLRAWYENFAPGAVRLATMPRGERSLLLLSHDIDWEYAVPKSLTFAAMEARHHVHSTFFMQAKYVSDANSRGFFFGPNLDVLRRLVAMGFDVESHTIIHSRVFNKFPYGTGEETYANYRPRATSQYDEINGTVLGEVRVSKELLDGALPGHQTTFFRAGHLRFPTSLTEALVNCSYEFDSSFTGPDVMSNFPFRLTYDRDFVHESPIYEFPVTIEDEEEPPFPDRIEAAFEVIKANADNGAPSVLLIHTNDEIKVPAEEALLNGLPPGIGVSDMSSFARFWRARDRLKWQVLPAGEPTGIILKIESAEPMSGLTVEFARSISSVDGGAQILADHHRLLLPDLAPGIEATFKVQY